MPFSSISTAEIAPGRPITAPLLQKFVDRDNYVAGQIGGIAELQFNNYSFEIDTDADGSPDGWTISTAAGANASISTVRSVHGSKGLKISAPTSLANATILGDYFPVSSAHNYNVQASQLNETVGPNLFLGLLTYDQNLVIATTFQISSTNTATSAWEKRQQEFKPAATVRYARPLIRLLTGLSGTVWIDEFQINEVLKTDPPLTTGDYVLTSDTRVSAPTTVSTPITVKKAYIGQNGIVKFHWNFGCSAVETAAKINNVSLVRERVGVQTTLSTNSNNTSSVFFTTLSTNASVLYNDTIIVTVSKQSGASIGVYNSELTITCANHPSAGIPRTQVF